MSDTENPEPTPAAPAEPTPDAAEKAKRERTSYPIRLQRQSDGGFDKPEGPAFNTIEQAERWILAEGEPGVAYLLARVIGARRRPKPVLEEVAL